MPMTVTDVTGDGVTADQLTVSLQLPDSGTTITLAGVIQIVGGTAVTVTPSSLTIPAAPGSGSIFYNVQVNTSTGAASVQQSTSADPAALAGNRVVYRQTISAGQTDPALVPESTPDSW